MLTHEDRALLGINLEARRLRRPSAVSQVLRAISADASGARPARLPGLAESPFVYRVANSRTLRERAYRLARQVYEAKGFVGAATGLAQPYDLRPETATLLGLDAMGVPAGTVTCVCDNGAGLPCDEVFPGSLAELRKAGRRLAEVTRLALVDEHQHEKLLLIQLMNLISIYARRVARVDDFIIEVNPRHVAFYRRMLAFEVLEPERPCPRVNGAPAVLLRLDLHLSASLIRKLAGQDPATAGADARSLYLHFMAYDAEEETAALLEFQHRAMSALDALHFGLVELKTA